jgi:hypothetical protein
VYTPTISVAGNRNGSVIEHRREGSGFTWLIYGFNLHSTPLNFVSDNRNIACQAPKPSTEFAGAGRQRYKQKSGAGPGGIEQTEIFATATGETAFTTEFCQNKV